MLEELHYAQAHWSEEVSIGRLVLKYTPDMVKAYPPFVNFFENTKEMLQQCDRENPRWLTDELPMISDLYGSKNLTYISFFFQISCIPENLSNETRVWPTKFAGIINKTSAAITEYKSVIRW